MEAIILAGGLGTRLRSVLQDVPKPMAPVNGRPFLELLLCSLSARGVERVILSLGHMAEVVTAYFDRHPVELALEYEVEISPLGTGGAIAAALRRVLGDWAFVFNADTYLELELSSLAAMWPGDRTPIVVVRSVPDTERFGRLECVGNRIFRFLGPGHKGPGVINAGAYVIPKDVFSDGVMPGAFSFEQDFLARRASMSLRTFPASGQFIDIGVPEDYARANSELRTICGGCVGTGK